MNWKPTHRWVASYYEIVNSETRHPSTQYESGYARRLYSGTPVLSFLNVLADRVWIYASFYDTDGAAQVDLSAEGGLDARTSDQFRVADNVKIPGAPKYRAYMRRQRSTWRTVEHKTRGEYGSVVPDLVLESEFLAR